MQAQLPQETTMVYLRREFSIVAALSACLLLAGDAAIGATGQNEGKKPSLSLKATPPISFSPARVRVVVEVRGGADDYEEFYCPTIEWEWGDGTSSENASDCDPYERGKSSIRRRFSADHVYRLPGNFKVLFRIKQKNKVIAATSANVQVRPGVREPFFE
jgi:hypothetical protein